MPCSAPAGPALSPARCCRGCCLDHCMLLAPPLLMPFASGLLPATEVAGGAEQPAGVQGGGGAAHEPLQAQLCGERAQSEQAWFCLSWAPCGYVRLAGRFCSCSLFWQPVLQALLHTVPLLLLPCCRFAVRAPLRRTSGARCASAGRGQAARAASSLTGGAPNLPFRRRWLGTYCLACLDESCMIASILIHGFPCACLAVPPLQREAVQPVQGDHHRPGHGGGGNGAAGHAEGAAQRAGTGVGDAARLPGLALLLLEPDGTTAGCGTGGRSGAAHRAARRPAAAQPALMVTLIKFVIPVCVHASM